MPGPRWLAHVNKRVTNRITGPVAGHLPWFAVVHHVGRTSARAYSTPVNAFRVDDGYTFALTYGRKADWVRNVVAAGGCEIETRGQRVRLTDPTFHTDPTVAWAPAPVRIILQRLGIHEYLHMQET